MGLSHKRERQNNKRPCNSNALVHGRSQGAAGVSGAAHSQHGAVAAPVLEHPAGCSGVGLELCYRGAPWHVGKLLFGT